MIGNDEIDLAEVYLLGEIVYKLFGKRFPDRINKGCLLFLYQVGVIR